MKFTTLGCCPDARSTVEAALPDFLSFQLQTRVATPRYASISGSARGNLNPVLSEFAKSSTPDGPQYYKVHKIVGDGKCMFRATVRSLAMNKGVFLRPPDEQDEADKLRMACHDALCRTSHRRKEFPDATKQILFGYGDHDEYCRQLAKPSFWGGEVEMMVISKMLKIPIFVYTSDLETKGRGSGFSVIAKFGEKFVKKQGSKPGRRPVRLLYTGGNHYDLLV